MDEYITPDSTMFIRGNGNDEGGVGGGGGLDGGSRGVAVPQEQEAVPA